MKELIDFNALQSEYIDQNMNFDESNFHSHEEYEEAQLERSYELSGEFLNKEMEQLGGKTPIDYFDEMDSKDIVDTLYSYYLELDDIPDALVQVISKHSDTAEGILELLKDDQNDEWFRIYLVDILNQLEYDKAMPYYCDVVLRSQEHDDLADAVIDALKHMDSIKVERCMMDLFDEASDVAKLRMLDILAVPNCDDKIFNYVIDKLYKQKGNRELFAYYIALIDDTRALPVLHEISEEEDLDYVDYIEIRNAIEKLGGICIERDYSKDPLYDRIHSEQ